MICINDYKDLKVGDQFLNKYISDKYSLCEIVKIGNHEFIGYCSLLASRWIEFIFLDEDELSELHDMPMRMDLRSGYSKYCFIIHRNKNLDILLNDSTSTITQITIK